MLQDLSVQAMGLKELQGAPLLPAEVLRVLDQTCEAVPEGEVRCLMAVPILTRIPSFMAAVTCSAPSSADQSLVSVNLS